MEKVLKNTQQNAEKEDNVNSNSELIQRIDVEGTPFTIIVTEEGAFGIMGKYRITEPTPDIEKLENELSNFNWDRLVQVTMLLIETMTKENTEKI